MANSTSFNMTLLEASKFKINTQYFSPHDLSLFVESLETITRLAREKEERKEQKKLQKLNNLSKKFCTLPRISSISTLDSSSTGASGDEEEILLLENKKVPKSPDSQRSEYDETYFSAPSSTQSSPRNSVIFQQQLSKNSSHSTLSIITTSDSEESGVFPIGTSYQDLYEPQNTTIRPRSKVITKSRSISTRSRLIGLVMKKDSAKVPSVELISHRPLDEYETLEMYEQEQQQMLQAELVQESEKLARFSTLHMKKKSRQGFACPDGSSEERFLDKALRYLTL
ncbi:uncharacterized protein LOC119609380 [Lucilia sericata]|uniref:uncharacterized protein LOC119609380 n=1 Tax=Lucilia sericata TaxID=13632 RepID=UPI0018A8043C|nr:uncharacterized protein LOC119609380 [Lucilia sericata]